MNKESVKAALTSSEQLTLGKSSKFDSPRLIVALVFMLVGLLLGGIIGYGVFGRGKATDYVIERDTSTYVDTIQYYQPVPIDSTVVRYVRRTLPVSKPQKNDTSLAENYAQNNGRIIPPQELASPKLLTLNHSCKHDGFRLTEVLSDERDSMAVEIPITQKRYESDDYRAYISGYEPRLDSIYVFPKTTVIRERSYKPPNKWHIGITGSYGYGLKSKQAEPYIGIGLTYSILSF